MKRVMVLMVAAIFLFSGVVFAAEAVKDKAGGEVKAKSGGEVKAKEKKAAPPKVDRKKASGTVSAISDTALKLQAKESMDFVLAKAYPDVKAGDKVTVTYVVKDGKNVAEKVAKAKPPAEKKAAAPGKDVKSKSGGEVKSKSGGEVKSKN